MTTPSETLYAWTCSGSTYGKPKTIYTKTQDASFLVGMYEGTGVYNENGVDITETDFLYGGTAQFSQGNTETITWVTYDPL